MNLYFLKGKATAYDDGGIAFEDLLVEDSPPTATSVSVAPYYNENRVKTFRLEDLAPVMSSDPDGELTPVALKIAVLTVPDKRFEAFRNEVFKRLNRSEFKLQEWFDSTDRDALRKHKNLSPTSW